MDTTKTEKKSRLLNPETIRKQLESTRKRFKSLLEDEELPKELRKYVNVMEKQLEKYAGKDLVKLKTFLKSERAVFARFRKNIEKYVKAPREELKKLFVKSPIRRTAPSNRKTKRVTRHLPRSTAHQKKSKKVAQIQTRQ